jgi:hypothetical protein
MILLKNTSESEEAIVKDRVITVARRIYEEDEYNKEFIMEVCNLTEIGYEHMVKRAVVMDCARKFLGHYRIEFLQEKLNLSEEEIKDLIKHEEEQKKNKELNEDEQ